MPGRRGAELLANAQAPVPGADEAAGRHVFALPVRPAAVGRQLCPPVWLRLRTAAVVRAAAVRLVRPVRPPPQDLLHLGVPALVAVLLRAAGAALLPDTVLRLRGVPLPELHSADARLLRHPEYQLQARGVRRMTMVLATVSQQNRAFLSVCRLMARAAAPVPAVPGAEYGHRRPSASGCGRRADRARAQTRSAAVGILQESIDVEADSRQQIRVSFVLIHFIVFIFVSVWKRVLIVFLFLSLLFYSTYDSLSHITLYVFMFRVK